MITISKPIDYTHLTNMVKAALMRRSGETSHQVSDTTVASADKPGDYEIIGNSGVMIDVMKKVGRIAASDVDVLICGESGTGKELVARAIHNNSDRRKGPFVDVNCSAIPSELIEAELFGIGKRVATAVDQRPGKFLQARGGTIFLDEIGDLGLAMQPKLLRVLDSKEGARGRRSSATRRCAHNRRYESRLGISRPKQANFVATSITV